MKKRKKKNWKKKKKDEALKGTLRKSKIPEGKRKVMEESINKKEKEKRKMSDIVKDWEESSSNTKKQGTRKRTTRIDK